MAKLILNGVLNQINGQMRDKFADLPVKQFLLLNKLHNFIKNERSPIFVLYMFARPINNLDISVDSSHTLSIGKLHYLYTQGYHFGYMFEFPKLRILRGPNYFGIERMKRKPKDYSVKPEHVNAHLVVYASNTDAVLATDYREEWVDREGWHGKRNEKK